MTRPVDDGFAMPAEWAAHRRCWIAWPGPAGKWGEHLEAARDACAEIARTIAEYEAVTVVAAPESLAEASLRCGTGVSCLPMPQDDCWMRDIGPTFLVGPGGASRLEPGSSEPAAARGIWNREGQTLAR